MAESPKPKIRVASMFATGSVLGAYLSHVVFDNFSYAVLAMLGGIVFAILAHLE